MAPKNSNTPVMEQPTATPAQPQPLSVANPNQAITPKKFTLVMGQHSGFDKNGVQRLWRQNEIVECYRVKFIQPTKVEMEANSDAKEKVVITSAYDLAKRFNQPDAIKFREVSIDTPSSRGLRLVDGNPVLDDEQMAQFEAAGKPQKRVEQRLDGNDDAFDTMTVDDLRKYAEENEIPLEEAESRDALLAAIRQYENLAHPLNQ
jgi:hypothetical protein